MLEPVESVSLCQAFVIPVSPRMETALFVASRPSSAFLSLCQLGVSCREREEEVQLSSSPQSREVGFMSRVSQIRKPKLRRDELLAQSQTAPERWAMIGKQVCVTQK